MQTPEQKYIATTTSLLNIFRVLFVTGPDEIVSLLYKEREDFFVFLECPVANATLKEQLTMLIPFEFGIVNV